MGNPIFGSDFNSSGKNKTPAPAIMTETEVKYFTYYQASVYLITITDYLFAAAAC